MANSFGDSFPLTEIISLNGLILFAVKICIVESNEFWKIQFWKFLHSNEKKSMRNGTLHIASSSFSIFHKTSSMRGTLIKFGFLIGKALWKIGFFVEEALWKMDVNEGAICKVPLWILFTFSSHTEYVKRESIVIAWVEKKKILSFWQMFMIFMS